MQATLTSKGQITIPATIRRRLGLKAGQVLDFDENTPYLKATKAIDPTAWKSFGNKASNPWATSDSKAILEHLRGPVELPPQRAKK